MLWSCSFISVLLSINARPPLMFTVWMYGGPFWIYTMVVHVHIKENDMFLSLGLQCCIVYSRLYLPWYVSFVPRGSCHSPSKADSQTFLLLFLLLHQMSGEDRRSQSGGRGGDGMGGTRGSRDVTPIKLLANQVITWVIQGLHRRP